ncbi:hypothetical protein [Natronoflexus pectinivorans]|uniref:Uncharacterized protein n=1 Tax=Natronoflexus pectinivorans TaxID=682526 RepID=A0A4R2GHJ5_9BACT|nr:hypothetical protein [Natronoflexus pectinivorans]TCO07898.1 hypothetical protein EV194_10639 [Natronoflexus pectinivorans]
MLNWILLPLVIIVGVSLWFYKYLLPVITKRKAQAILYNIIFPNGSDQKKDVMKRFHEFTKHRFSDEQILDYFIKIKGLQSMNVCNTTNFWIRKYLLSPTEIKLNYFEQVKFYELFMNYPGKSSNRTLQNSFTNVDEAGENGSEITITKPTNRRISV